MNRCPLISKAFIVLLGTAIMSCTLREQPSPAGPTPARQGGAIFTSYDFECSTVACIDSALENYTSGDVIYIYGDRTYDFGSSQYTLDETVTLLGEDTTAILKKSAGSGSQTFLFLNEATGGTQNFTARNLKFLMTSGSASRMFFAQDFNRVHLKNCVLECQSANEILFQVDSLTIDACRIFNGGITAINQRNRIGNGFYHLINNSSLRSTAGFVTLSQMQNGIGAVTYDSCYFYGASAAKFHQLRYIDNGGTYTLNLSNNHLEELPLNIEATPSDPDQHVVVNYDDNYETASLCVEPTLACSGCPFDIQLNISQWFYNDSLFAYEGFNNFDLVEKCLVGDTVYVVFHTDSVGYNYVYDTAEAQYGDDACDNATTAWRNGLNRWNAKFYVGYITDTDFYWRPRVTFCEKTIQKLCIKFPMRECDDEIPLWFQQQRR